MCGLVLGYIMAGVMMLASCSQAENDQTEDLSPTTTDAPAEARPLVHHEVTVSLNDGATTRVVATPGTVKNEDNENTNGLILSWSENETLGVYIKKSDNSIVRAGSVSSTGEAGKGTRTFTGSVSAKADGESYIYMHPDLGSQTSIDYTTQTGTLGSTAHLSQYIPLVWREENLKPENQGYVFHLTLTMKEDPGAISAITLHTMKQGTDGTTEDRIFPKMFDVNNLALAVNSTLSSKANGLSLSTDCYTNEIKLLPATGQSFTAALDNGTYKVDAYIAASSVEKLDVFRTKYNVKLDAENGPFFVNEYLSFPGQQDATSESGLEMLENGKCYNLERVMSKNVAYTVISDLYKVNSLLGMWNQYGKPFDPFGLICTDDKVPTQLKANILDKKADFTAKTLVNPSPQKSPTFTWTMVTNQCGGYYKQNNVTYNNIEIINEPTEVFVTFISEYAWSQNLLGYYHYPTGSVPSHPSTVLKTFIFPNVSKGGHVPYNKGGTDGGANVNPNTASANVGTPTQAPLHEYTTVQLLYYNADGTVSKTFPVGTTIGFMIMRDPKASTSGHDEGTTGGTEDISHSDYQPRTDNSLVDWSAWRLFTNTAWNNNNSGWWDSSCWNFFCSADVGDKNNGGVISGLAFYGAKDDASHNYNYSFSAMLYMVSTSEPGSMKTSNNCYFNIGTGDQVISK